MRTSGSGPQFIDVDAPADPGGDTPTVEQLRRDIAAARARGDSQSVLRGVDMLLKLEGAYDAPRDGAGDLADAELCSRIADLLAPTLGLDRQRVSTGLLAALAGK